MSKQLEWAKEIVKYHEGMGDTSGAVTLTSVEFLIVELARAIIADATDKPMKGDK